MEPKDVKAHGIDYSAGEFAPRDLDNPAGLGLRVDVLGRYIGYPGNPKCISHYPGAYRAHVDAGRAVVLFHQIAYRDFEGGEPAGRAHAQTALADARSIGWDGEGPIVACMDRRMAAFTDRFGNYYRALTTGEVRGYMKGFVDVIGYDASGAYGFEDFMQMVISEDLARFRMQCGARSQHVPGISAWQENNYQPTISNYQGTPIQVDVLEVYIPLDEIGGEGMAANWSDVARTIGEGDSRRDIDYAEMLRAMDDNGGKTRDDVETVLERLDTQDRRLAAIEEGMARLSTGTGYTLEQIGQAVWDASKKEGN